LDEEATTNPPAVFALYEAAAARVEDVSGDLLEELLNHASSLFEKEEDRQKSSEDRAGNLIAAAGVVAPLLIGVGALLSADDGWNWHDILVALMYLIPLAYLSVCTARALDVQRSKTRHTLGPDELIPDRETKLDDLRRTLISTLIHHTSENYKVNNRQMLALNRAQVFFRNAVVSAILTGIVAVVLSRSASSALTHPSPSPKPTCEIGASSTSNGSRAWQRLAQCSGLRD
jgi:hypothetical protein